MNLTSVLYKHNVPINIEDLNMALLSELVTICEEQRLDTAATLNVFARRLREAGRISKAGRGRGAAHMTFLDAARFLIACAATDHPERAADAEYVFSNMGCSYAINAHDEFASGITKEQTLDQALAKTLELLAEGTIDAVAEAEWKEELKDNKFVPPAPKFVNLFISRSAGGANLRVLQSRYHYNHPALIELMKLGDLGGAPAQFAVQGAFERETHRFHNAKNLTAELEITLLRAVANLIAGKA